MPNTITISRLRDDYEAAYGHPSTLSYGTILALWQLTSTPANGGKHSRPRGRHVPAFVLNNRAVGTTILMNQLERSL